MSRTKQSRKYLIGRSYKNDEFDIFSYSYLVTVLLRDIKVLPKIYQHGNKFTQLMILIIRHAVKCSYDEICEHF